MEHMQMSNRGPHRRLNKRLNYGLKFVFVLSLSMFQQLFPKCFLQNQHFAANLFLPTARKPAQRFCGFLYCDMLGAGGGVGGGCNNVRCVRYHRFFSANTLPVTLHTSVLGRGWVGGV